MKVSVKQLKAMAIGESHTLKVDHPRELQSIRVTAGYVHLNYPELGKRYKTSINRPKMEITIKVVKAEQPLRTNNKF